MIEFLTQQLSKIEEELKQLYVDRSRCSIETLGSYEIMINRKKGEYEKLQQDIDSYKKRPNIATEELTDTKLSKEKVKQFIANGKTKDAITFMLSEWNNDEVLLISSRFEQVSKSSRMGTISSQEYNLELARVNNSLLSILNDL